MKSFFFLSKNAYKKMMNDLTSAIKISSLENALPEMRRRKKTNKKIVNKI